MCVCGWVGGCLWWAVWCGVQALLGLRLDAMACSPPSPSASVQPTPPPRSVCPSFQSTTASRPPPQPYATCSADADFSCFADLALTSPVDYYRPGQGSLMQCVITPAEPYLPKTNEEIAAELDKQVGGLVVVGVGRVAQRSSLVRLVLVEGRLGCVAALQS